VRVTDRVECVARLARRIGHERKCSVHGGLRCVVSLAERSRTARRPVGASSAREPARPSIAPRVGAAGYWRRAERARAIARSALRWRRRVTQRRRSPCAYRRGRPSRARGQTRPIVATRSYGWRQAPRRSVPPRGSRRSFRSRPLAVWPRSRTDGLSSPGLGLSDRRRCLAAALGVSNARVVTGGASNAHGRLGDSAPGEARSISAEAAMALALGKRRALAIGARRR
jgi:hypothetical protein